MSAFHLELPATVEHLAQARHRLRRWLVSEVAGEEDVRDDLLAVAGEFFLHVVFRTGGLGRARVVAERADRGVRLAVTTAEARNGVVRPLVPASDPLAAGAIGRRLVDGCCDEVQVVGAGDRVGAECFRRLT